MHGDPAPHERFKFSTAHTRLDTIACSGRAAPSRAGHAGDNESMSKVFFSVGMSLDGFIGGGADVITQYLNAGLIEDFSIAVAPLFIGKGLRLFDGVDTTKVSVEIVNAAYSKLVTHLHYAVR